MAMKGPKLHQELEDQHEELAKIDFSHIDTKSYTLTGNEKRNIAFFRKTSS
jgi:hypothetical protein